MSSKTLSWLIRFAVIVCGAGGMFFCVFAVPQLGGFFANSNSFPLIVLLWMLLLYAAIAPCYVVFVMVWMVSIDVAKETVFSFRTAKLISISSIIALVDSAVLMAGTFILSLFNIETKSGYLLLIAAAAGFMLGLFAAVLARYVTKAAELKELSEGTV